MRATTAAKRELHADVFRVTCSALTKPGAPNFLHAALVAEVSHWNCKSCSQRPTCSSHRAATHQGAPVARWHQGCSTRPPPAQRWAAEGLRRAPAAAAPAVCEPLWPAGSQQHCTDGLVHTCDEPHLLPSSDMDQSWHPQATLLAVGVQRHTAAIPACCVLTRHVSCL